MSLLLFVIWVVLNGRLSFEIVISGIMISVGITCFSIRYLDYKLMKDWRVVHVVGYSFWYVSVLVMEVIKANIEVIKIVLSPTLEVEPYLFIYQPGLKSEVSRVILANSITLTPGTITVKLEGDTYWVHCLSKEMAKGVEESKFVEILRKAEGKMHGNI